MADQIRINKNIHSWGSITLKVGGEKFHGFTALEYGDKRERTFKWGMSKSHKPRGRTSGKYTPEPGKLVGPVSTVQALLVKLAAMSTDGKSFGDPEFPVIAQFTEAGEIPVTIELVRTCVDGVKDSHSESAEALEQEMSLSYFEVIRNGLSLAASKT
jgi:hypothetical protein